MDILFYLTRMNENMEFHGVTGDYIEWLQTSFVKVIRQQIEDSHENRFIPREERGKVKSACHEKLTYLL